MVSVDLVVGGWVLTVDDRVLAVGVCLFDGWWLGVGGWRLLIWGLVVGCSRLAVRYWQLVFVELAVGCWRLAVGCWQLVFLELVFGGWVLLSAVGRWRMVLLS